MSTLTLIALIVAVLAIALAVWALLQREKTRKLKRTFGPEYDRVMEQERSSRRAEAVLEKRQKRVEKYHIRPLSSEECDRFGAKWRVAQEHFVDNPREALAEADALITEAMRMRGYPMSDFDQRAADLSVDHPHVIEDYWIAHEIAMRDAKGPAATEDQRRAMQHYRSLFEHVIDTRVLQHH
ncbi:MAG TPA: hypothetical protein VMT32_01985 [Bryobacteraceae bacterium]|nr:hypothetical protein [Bryobacteraceae bacterium]